MKKVLAGRAAVDYYLAQVRRGLTDYYLSSSQAGDSDGASSTLVAPGSSWWGGGAAALELSGEVGKAEFVRMYAKGVRPDADGYLGSKFRLPGQAAFARQEAIRAAQELEDPYERWMAGHEARRKGGKASVAAWDCTFSPVKSVSLLWASGDRRVQGQVWAAHLAAVDAGLGYLEEHAAYVRAGRNGVRILDTSGLVVARMNEWTSRDGDMQIHTHCLVLNRAQTSADGKWRALDGRCLLKARAGAGALYNRVVEAELTRRLGTVWRDRDDGLRELEGVDDELIAAFSTRRRAITKRLAGMVDAYRAKHGYDPPPAVVSAMAQDVTLKTRRRKRQLSPTGALDRWEKQARRQGRALRRLPRKVIGRAARSDVRPDRKAIEAKTADLLERLRLSGRATFTRHDLLRAALDVIPPAAHTPAQLRDRAERLAAHALGCAELLTVTAPDPIEAPGEVRRRDGTSVYEQPFRGRWALRSTLDEEAWLLDVATEPSGSTVDTGLLDAAVAAHGLGDDQAQAVRQLLASDRRIGLLVGPAGAGKTRTLRAAVDAWHNTGGQVLGLTVSQAAAGVLADEAQVRAENTAKWLHETINLRRWHMPPGALVLVDEASMVSTSDLVDIVDQARQAGGKVLLVGDPAQLAAIHIGGAFDLLAERHGASHLSELRRFTEPWEANASLQLRQRDPAALAAYAMRGRIHGGQLDGIEDELFTAWRADALGADDRSRRASVLMIVSTNEQAAVLAERARNALIASRAVSDGPTVKLRDNVASVGDHIVTRRNNRKLRTSPHGWVVNGDVWTVTGVNPDGAATLRRHRDRATITLDANYLAEHVHLAYATTAHRAQGMTVDACHATVTVDTSHEALYVAATRGRNANHLWVIVDSERDVVRDPDDLPTPEHVLSRVLQRRDPDRLSAHQVIQDSQTATVSLARIGAIFEDAARTATDRWLRQTLTARGLARATGDREWPSLVTHLRRAALAGHDISTLVDEAITMRPTDDAASVAAVLHWRLGMLTAATPPARTRGPLGSLPPAGETPATDIARQAGELMRQRWRDIRTDLALADRPLAWAPELGARPADPQQASAWLTAATPVAAYRERYEIPAHTPMLGPRPTPSRPDARAAYDHARLQADRYLARRLHDLEDRQLDELAGRMTAIIEDRPAFDPERLQQARRTLDAATRTWRTTTGPAKRRASAERDRARRTVRRLEHAADTHARWRRAAQHATDTLRQIRLEHQRRTRRRTDQRRPTRPVLHRR